MRDLSGCLRSEWEVAVGPVHTPKLEEICSENLYGMGTSRRSPVIRMSGFPGRHSQKASAGKKKSTQAWHID